MKDLTTLEKTVLRVQNALILGALGFVGWAMAGCSLQQGGESRVRVELPERLTLDPLMWLDRGVVVPSQFRCFGLNVSGPGMPQMPGLKDSCTAADAGRPRLGLIYGSVSETQGFEVLVPAGPARVFQLVGMEGVEGQPCPKVEDLIRGQVNGGDAYKPYELAVATVDVFGDTAVTLRIDESRVENKVCFIGEDEGGGGGGQFVFASSAGGPQAPLPPGHWRFPTTGVAAADCYPLRLREQTSGGQGIEQQGPWSVSLSAHEFDPGTYVRFYTQSDCSDAGSSTQTLEFATGQVDSHPVYVRASAAQHSLIGLSTTATGRNLPPGLLLSFGAGSAARSLVQSFGVDGIQVHDVTDALTTPMTETPQRISRGPEGKLYVLGTTLYGNYTVARLLPAGDALDDTSFGTGGAVARDGSAGSNVNMMSGQLVPLPQRPGQFLVVGGRKSTNTIQIWRGDLQNGALDPTFGTGGMQSVATSPLGAVSAIDLVQTVVEPGLGRIWVIGNFDHVSGNTFRRGFVMRLLADGTLDTGFGAAGFLSSGLVNSEGEFRDAAIDGADLVLAGRSGPDANPRASVWRMPLNAGSIPSPTVIGANDSVFETLGFGPSGEIWLAGSERIVGRDQLLAARLNADFTFDATFNSGQKLLSDLGNSTFDYVARRLIPAPGTAEGVMVLVRTSASNFRVVSVDAVGTVGVGTTPIVADPSSPVDLLAEMPGYRFLVLGSTLSPPNKTGLWKFWF